MTLTEMREYLTAVLGRSGTSLNTTITAALDLAQRQMEGGAQLPWFLISEVATATATIGDERLELPNNFLREVEEEGALFVYYDAGDGENEWKPLVKRDNDYLRSLYSDSVADRGRPVYYALVGNYFKLYPIPDIAYPMRMLYYKADTLFSNLTAQELTANQWSTWAPDVILAMAGTHLANRFRDAKAKQLMAQDLQPAISRMWVEDEARRQANLLQWLGMNDD